MFLALSDSSYYSYLSLATCYSRASQTKSKTPSRLSSVLVINQMLCQDAICSNLSCSQFDVKFCYFVDFYELNFSRHLKVLAGLQMYCLPTVNIMSPTYSKFESIESFRSYLANS